MRQITQTIFLVILASAVACGGGQYADAKKVLSDQVTAFEEYIEGLDKAESAGDVADALNRFADSMEKLAPRMKQLQEKYPELAGMQEADLPEALRDEVARLKEATSKMMSASMKMSKYAADEAVVEANKRLQRIMAASMPE